MRRKLCQILIWVGSTDFMSFCLFSILLFWHSQGGKTNIAPLATYIAWSLFPQIGEKFSQRRCVFPSICLPCLMGWSLRNLMYWPLATSWAVSANPLWPFLQRLKASQGFPECPSGKVCPHRRRCDPACHAALTRRPANQPVATAPVWRTEVGGSR